MPIYDPEITAAISRFDLTRCYVRGTWDANWELATYLEAINATWAASPQVGTATLAYNYGVVKREDLDSFTDYYPQDLIRQFVQIRVVIDPGDNEYEEEIWTGMIVSDALDMYGDNNELNISGGTQMLYAADLKHLLNLQIVRQAIVNQDSEEKLIDHVPSMNASGRQGNGVFGNRSTSANAAGIYRFSGDGAEWTHRQFLDMILYDSYYDVEFELSGQYAQLDQIVTAAAMEGRSVKQILDLLIDRRRGFGWGIDLVGTGRNPIVGIKVFSVFSEEVTVGDVTISPSTEIIEMDITDAKNVDPVQLQLSAATQYNNIQLWGSRIKSCFTLRVTAGELETAWKATEETAYKDAAKNITGYSSLSDDEKKLANDRYRSEDRFRRVYRCFRLANTWNWKASGKVVNPSCDESGDLDDTDQGEYLNFARSFLRQLPLQEGYDYTQASPTNNNPTNAEPEFLPAQCWVKYGTKYYPADRIGEYLDGAPSMSLRMMDGELGIELGSRPNHLLADNHFSASEPSGWTAVFDYDDVVITMAIATDQRMQLFLEADNIETAGADSTLIINVPDAEGWYIAEDTIVGVSDAGVLETYEPTSRELRNDKEKLQQIGAAALAWYGKQRQILNLGYKYIALNPVVGDLVQGISATSGYETVDTVVTSIAYNFRECRTRVLTGYAELDFAAISTMQDMPGIGDARGLSRTLAQQQRAIESLTRHTANLPTRQGSGQKGGGGSTMRIAEVDSNATGGGYYNCHLKSLDATDWNTITANQLDDVGDTVVVLNLSEIPITGDTSSHVLAVGDEIICWQVSDDENNSRYVGLGVLRYKTDCE